MREPSDLDDLSSQGTSCVVIYDNMIRAAYDSEDAADFMD
jgi:hypothetical protein